MIVAYVWGQTSFFHLCALMMDGSGLYMVDFHFWEFIKNYPKLGVDFLVKWPQNLIKQYFHLTVSVPEYCKATTISHS